MAEESSHGREIRPSQQTAFRAYDRVHSNRPNLEQATKPTTHKGPDRLKRLRNIALALGMIAGAGAGTALVANEISKPPAETLQNYNDQLKQIDTNRYLITIHKEGEKDLVIRHDPYIPEFGDRQEGRDNNLSMDDVVSINGIAWDGKSPVILENTPIAMATDPTNGILEAPWFAVTIGKKSLLGDITETVGFISHSGATDAHITPIGDEGGIASAHFENGQLTGKNEYGEEIIPTENVGLARIATPAEIAQTTNPQ